MLFSLFMRDDGIRQVDSANNATCRLNNMQLEKEGAGPMMTGTGRKPPSGHRWVTCAGVK